jgi:hypothetical protein
MVSKILSTLDLLHMKLVFFLDFIYIQGSVHASQFWGDTAENLPLKPAEQDSYEGIFHQVGLPGFYLVMRYLYRYLSYSIQKQ